MRMTPWEVSTLHKWGGGDVAALVARMHISRLAASHRASWLLFLAALAPAAPRAASRPRPRVAPARTDPERSDAHMKHGPPARNRGGPTKDPFYAIAPA